MTRNEDATSTPASPWVTRWLTAVEPGDTVLDVACGRGRHIGAALARGHKVVGVDRNLQGNPYAAHGDVALLQFDLEDGAGWPLGERRFAGVVVTNYLHRAILPTIVAAVADDGALIYETFAVGQETIGRPQRPDFLLRPGELLDAVAGRLIPFAFEHVRLAAPDRLVQRIAAVGPRHRWIVEPASMPAL